MADNTPERLGIGFDVAAFAAQADAHGLALTRAELVQADLLAEYERDFVPATRALWDEVLGHLATNQNPYPVRDDEVVWRFSRFHDPLPQGVVQTDTHITATARYGDDKLAANAASLAWDGLRGRRLHVWHRRNIRRAVSAEALTLRAPEADVRSAQLAGLVLAHTTSLSVHIESTLLGGKAEPAIELGQTIMKTDFENPSRLLTPDATPDLIKEFQAKRRTRTASINPDALEEFLRTRLAGRHQRHNLAAQYLAHTLQSLANSGADVVDPKTADQHRYQNGRQRMARIPLRNPYKKVRQGTDWGGPG